MSPDRISISPIPTRSDLIVAEARTWVGTRWVHQGRSRAGVDCAGLVLKVADALGFEHGDMQGYKRNPNALAFLTHIRSLTDLADTPAPGLIGVFRQSKYPCHVGIFSVLHGELHMIHGYAGLGEVVEEHFTHEWPSLLVEVRSFREMV